MWRSELKRTFVVHVKKVIRQETAMGKGGEMGQERERGLLGRVQTELFDILRSYFVYFESLTV